MTGHSPKSVTAGGSGYKNPPQHSQWKKGQSGNPSGKPKKAASIEAKLKKLAAKEIVVYENGTAVSMSQDEAMLVAVFMKAMKGDMTAVKFITETLSHDGDQAHKPLSLSITPDDLKVLENRLLWVETLQEARAQVHGDNPDETSIEEEKDDENDTF